MPKPTFFNLAEEKRQALLDIAIEEFASNNYHNASISRIVARAGIAKGSLYQYFEDKKDLYLYLLDLATEEKMSFFAANQPPDTSIGLFPMLRWMMEVSTRLQFSNPKLVQVAYRAMYSDVPFPEEVDARVRSATDDTMRYMIERGIETGSIDPQVDPTVATFVFSTVMLGIGDHIFRQGLIDGETLEEHGMSELVDATKDLIDNVFYILEHGMGAKQPAGSDAPALSHETGQP